MSDLFDFKQQSCDFAVMGNPVKHSKSPQIHQLFAQQFDIAMQYNRIQVDAGGFEQAVSHFFAQGGAGLNITLPFKVEAWQLCGGSGNQLSERAQLAEAVNTLRIRSESGGGLFGDNTDGVGIIRDLEKNLGVQLNNKRVLVMGAGGAVRGIIGALAQHQPSSITIANRTVNKAQALAEKFRDIININGCGYPQLQDSFDLIINGTAASLDDKLPDISENCLNPDSVMVDMMYAPEPTVFMRWASQHGAKKVSDGLGMLVEQAAESFYIWHNKRPDTAPVISALREK